MLSQIFKSKYVRCRIVTEESSSDSLQLEVFGGHYVVVRIILYVFLYCTSILYFPT